MDEKVRGFKMAISLELFSDIIGNALGLDPDTIQVRDASTAGWHRAIEISATTYDKRFPELEEGKQFPLIYPRMVVEYEELEDGKTLRKVSFDGFEVG